MVHLISAVHLMGFPTACPWRYCRHWVVDLFQRLLFNRAICLTYFHVNLVSLLHCVCNFYLVSYPIIRVLSSRLHSSLLARYTCQRFLVCVSWVRLHFLTLNLILQMLSKIRFVLFSHTRTGWENLRYYKR